MEMSERKQIEEELKAALRIEQGQAGEWRYVTYGPIALGRLRRNEESGRYQLEWLADWKPYPTESEAADFEHAEGWAVEGIASMMAMGAQARSLHG